MTSAPNYATSAKSVAANMPDENKPPEWWDKREKRREFVAHYHAQGKAAFGNDLIIDFALTGALIAGMFISALPILCFVGFSASIVSALYQKRLCRQSARRKLGDKDYVMGGIINNAIRAAQLGIIAAAVIPL